MKVFDFYSIILPIKCNLSPDPADFSDRAGKILYIFARLPPKEYGPFPGNQLSYKEYLTMVIS